MDILLNKLQNEFSLLEKYFSKGEHIYSEGSSIKGLYILKSGHVKIVKNVLSGNRAILHFCKPGDIIGVDDCLNKKVFTKTAIAHSDVISYQISGKEFSERLKSDSELKLEIMKYLSKEITTLENKLCSIYKKSITQRICELIIYLYETYGSDKDGFIKLKLTFKEFSELTGTSIEYVSKILGEFQKSKIIFVESGKIKIQSCDKLYQIAAFQPS